MASKSATAFANVRLEDERGSQNDLRVYFDALHESLGPQSWWPARTPFEVIVGAILTQNTSWTNVEKAITNLRREKLLTPGAIECIPTPRLARLIRSSGYFRQKAKKLKAFVTFLRREFRGSLRKMFSLPTEKLRELLLAVHGIGPETADSILLYAAKKPAFVVDAYTKRVLLRHGIITEKTNYEETRALFENSLPHDVQLFNEYHALLVQVGKNWCRPREARCGECSLGQFLPQAQPVLKIDSARGAHA
ncbi:MAG: endonuclease III domain-containing protein [Acidobacteria bacterium]|nr:endonuclease III domain-containing protein [Acidobacteriota bacterium]